MPNARRIIFSTYVVPTYSIQMEETSVTKKEFQSSPNGTLGGKGSATINATQWGDGWTSFSHQGAYWEDQSDVWELTGETWSGELSITTTGANHQLTSDSSDLAFLYIKNTGRSNNAEVSLTGGGGSAAYLIIIPPNGSVHLRGDGTNLECNEVYIQSSANTTTIEYIIAKE